MTAIEKHIKHFNRLNGKVVTKKTLQKFLDKLPIDPALATVRKKLTKAVTLVGKKAELRISNLVKYNPPKVEAKKGKPSKLKGLKDDSIDLHGLEQNPPEAQEQNLGFTKDGQQKIYDMVTDMLLDLMKSDGLFWRLPWDERKGGLMTPGVYAVNYNTKKAYRGINFIVLNIYAHRKRKISSPYYLTYKQAEQLGGQVRKGAKSLPVFYFNYSFFINKPTKKRISFEQYKAMSNEEKKAKDAVALPLLQYYNVFSAEDITGIKFPDLPERNEGDPIVQAENIVEGMPNRPEITHSNKTRAYYSPASDLIHMPNKPWFEAPQKYYSTLFHEMVHSTGHESRLDRKFGKEDEAEYAFEELIAELGASYLCAESGILYFTMKNSAAYLKDWKSQVSDNLKRDPKFFLKAAAKAQRATDYILDLREDFPEPEPTQPETKSYGIRQPMAREKKRGDRKPAKALAGFTTADQEAEAVSTEKLPGEIGEFLQNLQRYKLAIVVAGETHSSKSEIGKQIADAFISVGDDVAWIDWEQGGLRSKHTTASIDRNIKPENRRHLHVSSEFPKTLDAIKGLAKTYRVIVLDSGTSLRMVNNVWMDELREQFPDVVWVFLMQQNTKGGTKGGSSAEFDLPIVIYTYRPDESDFKKNYAKLFKNRGNNTGLYYNISEKKIIPNPEKA